MVAGIVWSKPGSFILILEGRGVGRGGGLPS